MRHLHFTFMLLAFAAVPALPAATQDAAPAKAVQSVLFMCPHGAAKSILASAYFTRLAAERGLRIRVVSRGTEPDPQVAPAVVAHLRGQGLPVPADPPRRVGQEDLAAADIVISVGCDLSGLDVAPERLKRWDDVPSPSEQPVAADAAIRAHVAALVEELARDVQARGARTP
jgi:arsenate reductase (thioredoxin)